MEYFIVANSFAAPFCSDTSQSYIEADSPEDALIKFKTKYTHPCGLFSANCYRNADAYHKGEKYLAQWLCNLEIERQKRTAGMSSYLMLHDKDDKGEFIEVNHEKVYVKDPKDGQIIESKET